MNNNIAYFNLAEAVIAKCFAPPKGNEKERKRVKAINRHFARHSEMIQMFCDASNNFEETRLRKDILNFNK